MGATGCTHVCSSTQLVGSRPRDAPSWRLEMGNGRAIGTRRRWPGVPPGQRHECVRTRFCVQGSDFPDGFTHIHVSYSYFLHSAPSVPIEDSQWALRLITEYTICSRGPHAALRPSLAVH